MKILENMDDCYGCSACMNRCAQDAIAMCENEEGFYIPVIDDSKCVGCGVCQQVCPGLHSFCRNTEEPVCMAGMASDEIRKKSASGGMFTLFAEYVLDLGGAVCGAAYDENFDVRHRIIEDKASIDGLRRSKYVQSDMGRTFSQAESILKENRYVLFTGTPCQIAGLKGFLQRDYERLITVDLICHAVSSPMAFRAYRDEASRGRAIAGMNFRSKDRGGFWESSLLKIEYANGECDMLTSGESLYYRGFMTGVINGGRCEPCRLNPLIRQGDISIGDFWAVDAWRKELNDGGGISILLANNQKGLDFIHLADARSRFLVDSAIPPDFVKERCLIRKSPVLCAARKEFLEAVGAGKSFAQAYSSIGKTMRKATNTTGCEIVCFGAGARFRRNSELLKLIYDVRYVCDNSAGKWGSAIDGCACISPEELSHMANAAVVVTIADGAAREEIRKQLTEMGVGNIRLLNEMV